MWRKGNICGHYCKLMQQPWKTDWRCLKILKVELPYHPATQLQGIYLKETKLVSQKDISSLCLLQHYLQDMETTLVSIMGIIYIYIYIYTHTHIHFSLYIYIILFSHKHKEILLFVFITT